MFLDLKWQAYPEGDFFSKFTISVTVFVTTAYTTAIICQLIQPNPTKTALSLLERTLLIPPRGFSGRVGATFGPDM